MVRIRRATRDDSDDFLRLILMATPYFPELFGKGAHALQWLFIKRANLFSYAHTYFIEVEGANAGMLLGYDWKTKKRENLRTGALLLKAVGPRMFAKSRQLMNFNRKIGKIPPRSYYISDIAIYPEFRGKGLGKRLMETAEKEAKDAGARVIVLDVEKENKGAVEFYKKLDFAVREEFSIPLSRKRRLNFYRMEKRIT